MTDLYDSRSDVLLKAARGAGLDPATLAARCELPTATLDGLLAGRDEPAALARLAPVLGLDLPALAHCAEAFEPVALPGAVQRRILPFEDETVNVWQLAHAEGCLLVDAGLHPADLRAQLDGDGPIDLLITHAHRDHIGGRSALGPRLRGGHAPETLDPCRPVAPGDTLAIGGLEIHVLDLGGHHPRAVGYLIDGLGEPILAVGDALFARSVGGCPDPQAYARARRTLVAAVRGLPDATLLLPGHGPATRLGRERFENPFLAAWLSAADAAP